MTTNGADGAPEERESPDETANTEKTANTVDTVDTAAADTAAEHTGTAEAGAAEGTVGDGETAAPDPENAVWRGPSAWVIPGLVAALGALGVWGGLTIEAPPNATLPGPGAFPGAVGVLLLFIAVCMTVINLRNRNTGDGASSLTWFEGRPVLLVLAGLVVHVALLEFLGWLLAGALLFWIVAYAFGARAYLRDAIVALSMSAAVQVGFSLGLGLSLPGGFLELVL